MVSLTFYLSRVIGKKIYKNNSGIGRIKDMVVDTGSVRPRVIAVKVKIDGEIKYLDYSKIKMEKYRGQYKISCSDLEDIKIPEENTLSLVKHILDKQIVDIDGRKLVRVNDLRLAILKSSTYLVAVDVGIEGLLRRLDVAKPMKSLFRTFGSTLPSKLILWDEVETVNVSSSGIKLGKTHSKLSTLHPSDLADIIEDMDRNTQAEIFATFDDEKAADILEELEPEAQISIIESMSIEKAADVLEKMPADEAADIIDELQEDKAEEILLEMENESSEEIRELMEYPENSVGSLMSKDFISFNEKLTVNDTIAELRKQKPEADMIYYLYVLDDEGRFVANVSLRDLIVSEPTKKLKDIMNRDVIKVFDHDRIDSLAEIISKYNLLALPVVNEREKMLGMVIIDDVIFNLLKAKRR